MITKETGYKFKSCWELFPYKVIFNFIILIYAIVLLQNFRWFLLILLGKFVRLRILFCLQLGLCIPLSITLHKLLSYDGSITVWFLFRIPSNNGCAKYWEMYIASLLIVQRMASEPLFCIHFTLIALKKEWSFFSSSTGYGLNYQLSLSGNKSRRTTQNSIEINRELIHFPSPKIRATSAYKH